MTMTLTNTANQMGFVQGTVTAADEAITLSRLITSGAAAIQITGTWGGTITFEVTADNTNWIGFAMTPSNSGTDVLTTTANGGWSKPMQGWSGIRARFSTASSGTPRITIRAVQNQK